MMKKTLIMFTIFISIVAAGIIKASTKSRVNTLETRVVNLSKSERKAWDTIAQLNAKLNKLEHEKQARKLAEYDEEEGIVEDYGDEDEEEDEEDRRTTRKPSRR